MALGCLSHGLSMANVMAGAQCWLAWVAKARPAGWRLMHRLSISYLPESVRKCAMK